MRALIPIAFLLGAITVYHLMREEPSPAASQSAPQALVVRQDSHRAIITFDSFSVEAGQTLQLQAPNPESSTILRVNSQEPTRINGTLSADHPVLIMAPGGVSIGADAQIQLPPASDSEGVKCWLPNQAPN